MANKLATEAVVNRVESSILILLGAAVLYAGTSSASGATLGPGLVPTVLGGLLVLMGLLGFRPRKEPGGHEVADSQWSLVAIAPVALATLVYVVSLHWISFVAATLLFAVSQAIMSARSRREALGIVVTGVIMTAFTVLVFENVFALTLP